MRGKAVMLTAILYCLAGMGCANRTKVPGGILPSDRMVEIVWDMAQADQYAALYLAKDSARINLKTETMRLYEEVFRLHRTTPEEFRKSYQYYLDHPELNQLLFDSAIARGVRARSEMYDRPGQYHPPVVPVRPGVGKPGTVGPGRPPGAVVPGTLVVPGARPGVGAPVPAVVRPTVGSPGIRRPGAVVSPGIKPAMRPGGVPPDLMRRMRGMSSQQQDSIMRAAHRQGDTAGTRN